MSINPDSASPSPNDAIPYRRRGKFVKGNPGGPGNPFAKRVAEIRTLLINSVSDDDLRGVMRALVSAATAGDVPAVRELLSRLVGPPVESDLLERLDALESKIAEIQEMKGALA